MAVVSIVGTTGVGKSFLVRQLAAATSSPAFFEGEEGTIPQEMFENIRRRGNPIERWGFFIERYRNNLERARKISSLGITCFVDGSNISAKAILEYEDEKYKHDLQKMIDSIKHLSSDTVLLLTADEGAIEKNMAARGRSVESGGSFTARAMKIQDAFLRLADSGEVSEVVDRTNLDFTNPDDVQMILDKIAA